MILEASDLINKIMHNMCTKDIYTY